jgi:hypothetical protein
VAPTSTLALISAERFSVCAADYPCLRSAIALPHTENRGLANSAASGVEFFGRVLVALFSAEIGFVNGNDTGELAEVRTASLTETTEHEPRRSFADATREA